MMGGSSKNPWTGTAPPPVYVPPPAPTAPAAQAWDIGPTINGRNYSVGMPAIDPDGSFDFPVAKRGLDRWSTPGPHYLTRATTGLQGSVIRAEFEVIGGPFFGCVGPQPGEDHTYVVLHFQRAGDSWSGEPPFAGYRWYSKARAPLVAGVHTLEVPLVREAWGDVYRDESTVGDFITAVANASRVGLTFGNVEGLGHGAAAEAPGARFALRSFVVA